MARRKKNRSSGQTIKTATASGFAKAKIASLNGSLNKKTPMHRTHKKYKVNAKPTAESLYNAIPVSGEKFNPEIDPIVFAQLCAWFSKEQPNETAGYFNWNEETNLIDWCWSDPNDSVQSGSHVIYGTAIVRMAWEADGNTGIPNGQWHTHPGLTVYWSTTDKESQLDFCSEITPYQPEGYFCFIVFDELDWLATKLVWKDGKIINREVGKVHINGVPLSGVETYHYQTSYSKFATSYSKPAGKVFTQPIQAPASQFKVSENTEKDFEYKGQNPKDDAYYLELFTIFFVPLYDWPELYLVIEDMYPGQYEDIIDEKVSWNWLRGDYDSRFFTDYGFR